MPLSDDIRQEDIDAYIACIEASAILGRSKRRLRLLTHLMQSEFLGHGDQLKAYSIGLDIFGNRTNSIQPRIVLFALKWGVLERLWPCSRQASLQTPELLSKFRRALIDPPYIDA